LAPQAPPSVISLPGASPTLLIAYPSASPTFSSTSPTLPGANLSHTRPTLSSVSPTFSSASPTLSAPTPSSTSVVGPFQFDPPHNATTCQNALFTWHFASSSAIQLTINITNEQTGLLAPSAGVRYTLSTNVSSDAQAFLWHVVDVPQGWYAAIAFDTQRTSNILAQSSPFFVLNGSDVACLASPSKSEAPSPHLSSSSLAGIVAGLVASVVIIAAVLSVPRLWKTVSIAKAGPRRPAHLF
jgi:hypothetical protein